MLEVIATSNCPRCVLVHVLRGPYGESEQPLPASASTPWDWFHINAVHLARNGTLLIDARNTWATYDVSRRSGAIGWQLGGKHSSFKIVAAPGQTLDSAGEIFAFQHYPEQVRVQPVGTVAVQCQVPGSGELLPGLPAAMARL